MKLNKKLIQQLRNGEIAVENSGNVEQLREVLKAAFPEYDELPFGYSKYYSRSAINTDAWTVLSLHHKSKPAFKISDFYRPELFTGWAKDDSYPGWMMYFKNDKANFGFDSFGIWVGEYNYECNYSEHQTIRPATHEEIEKHLIQEAKRRGYKGGNTIKGIHGTTHSIPGNILFRYDPENDRLLTVVGCIVYEDGQWAEIVEKPKPQPKKSTAINYLVDGMEYSFNYQDLKSKYQAVVNYSDEQFMDNLPEIAHLACIISYFKGLGTQATISDKGIIHELIHLMTDPEEPTNDLAEIREKFNRLIKLV